MENISNGRYNIEGFFKWIDKLYIQQRLHQQLDEKDYYDLEEVQQHIKLAMH